MTPDGLRELVQAATPGPWEHIVEVGDEWWFGDGNQARVRASDDSPWNTVAVMFCRDDSPDARLIALAPELAALLADAMEALYAKEHQSGVHVRNDEHGHHWLRCVDCGGEWAEDDSGAVVNGDTRCGDPDLLARFDKLGSGQ